jgi:hypothetical protein
MPRNSSFGRVGPLNLASRPTTNISSTLLHGRNPFQPPNLHKHTSFLISIYPSAAWSETGPGRGNDAFNDARNFRHYLTYSMHMGRRFRVDGRAKQMRIMGHGHFTPRSGLDFSTKKERQAVLE